MTAERELYEHFLALSPDDKQAALDELKRAADELWTPPARTELERARDKRELRRYLRKP